LYQVVATPMDALLSSWRGYLVSIGSPYWCLVGSLFNSDIIRHIQYLSPPSNPSQLAHDSDSVHLLLCLASFFCPLLLLIDTNRSVRGSETECGVLTPTGYFVLILLLHRSCKCLFLSPLYQISIETGVLDHTISKTPAQSVAYASPLSSR
jgi:hypothetical protein